MPHREGFDLNASNMTKGHDHVNDTRQTAGERSEHAPMSLDFSVFGMNPPNRPTINRYAISGILAPLDEYVDNLNVCC